MKAYLAVLSVVVVLAQLEDSSASHSQQSLPCSVSIRGQMLPVSYLESPRNNPDGTYYPGDAFYYLIWYWASPTCVGFSADPLEHKGLDMHGTSGDSYVDAASLQEFAKTAKSKCDTAKRYSGCVYGMATVQGGPKECTRVDPDRCISHDAELFQKVTGLKKVCRSTGEGVRCFIVPVVRTITLTPDILVPELDVILNTELVQSSDGYDARNIDKTYYLWDPIVIRQVPELLWKNNRSNTIHFEVTRTPDSQLETFVDCASNQCTRTLKHPGMRPSVWSLGNGDDITVYNATDDSKLGRNFFLYDVVATNAGLRLDSDSEETDVLVVRYDPEYSQYPYSVLSDDHRTSYENRVGTALHYFGSFGGGPDDPKHLYEDRRSKINDFSYVGVGLDPWNPVVFDDVLSWNKVQDAGVLESHQKVSESRYPDVQPSSSDVIPCESETHGTAMMVRAGYCTVYFEYPILDTIHDDSAGPRYENATLFNTLVSDHFAGRQTHFLSHYEYRFAEPLFHTNLVIKPIRDDALGNSTVDVLPRKGVQSIAEYLNEKVIHDSKDPGFGLLISNDTYLTEYSESGSDTLNVKLRRIASLFESYQDTSGRDVTGLDIVELAPEYLGNSRDARLEIPLDVGLGALSPISLNVTVDGTSRSYEYGYVDFGTDIEITANTSQENILEISRSRGSVTLTAPEDFGEIARIYADGAELDVTCNRRCVINMPDDRQVEFVAENYWGGKAYGTAEKIIHERIPFAGSNVMVLASFALSVPLLYWVYRRIKNRSQNS